MMFHIAKAAVPTGNLLKQLVEAELLETKLKMPANVEICYGVGYNGTNKVLNGNCSKHNKMSQAQILRRSLGERALDILDSQRAVAHFAAGGGPLFARNITHTKGRDIKIALEAWQVQPLVQCGTGFFTPHIPSVREFRTWGYRGYHLGTYEKALTRPAECRKLGRNYANGFDFNGIENENVPDGLKAICRDALYALGLDFGAVDTLQRADGTYVVLEVNSAPGVAHERRRVITGLAHRIVRWIASDCPARKE
jgi:hypothetical protein